MKEGRSARLRASDCSGKARHQPGAQGLGEREAPGPRRSLTRVVCSSHLTIALLETFSGRESCVSLARVPVPCCRSNCRAAACITRGSSTPRASRLHAGAWPGAEFSSAALSRAACLDAVACEILARCPMGAGQRPGGAAGHGRNGRRLAESLGAAKGSSPHRAQCVGSSAPCSPAILLGPSLHLATPSALCCVPVPPLLLLQSQAFVSPRELLPADIARAGLLKTCTRPFAPVFGPSDGVS